MLSLFVLLLVVVVAVVVVVVVVVVVEVALSSLGPRVALWETRELATYSYVYFNVELSNKRACKIQYVYVCVYIYIYIKSEREREREREIRLYVPPEGAAAFGRRPPPCWQAATNSYNDIIITMGYDISDEP